MCDFHEVHFFSTGGPISGSLVLSSQLGRPDSEDSLCENSMAATNPGYVPDQWEENTEGQLTDDGQAGIGVDNQHHMDSSDG